MQASAGKRRWEIYDNYINSPVAVIPRECIWTASVRRIEDAVGDYDVVIGAKHGTSMGPEPKCAVRACRERAPRRNLQRGPHPRPRRAKSEGRTLGTGGV